MKKVKELLAREINRCSQAIASQPLALKRRRGGEAAKWKGKERNCDFHCAVYFFWKEKG